MTIVNFIVTLSFYTFLTDFYQQIIIIQKSGGLLYSE